ncbi:MAG: DUF6252 family protein [Candidatus Pseudobacter hemicellulosilyticus]|uniref:DUF6252 family protein n=1 Tax=Candidatus Pseudobacter hemicellulosilyticus TaxID=3121375 RepID=A0AAJ6BGG3_9BACT|nr:MAG: DUF6252 family protein [Pseudobacter sp.]
MIKHIRLLTALMAVLALASCAKEKSVDTTTSGGVGALRVKIDGVQWDANKAVTASVMNGVILIAGTAQDGKELVIRLEATTPGDYQLDQQSMNVLALTDTKEAAPAAYTSNQGQDQSQAGGTVTVTSIDAVNRRISGTFSVKLYRDIDDVQKTLTEGVFENIPYTTEIPPTGSDNSTLTSKINGTDFSGHNVTGLIAFNGLIINAVTSDGTKSVGLRMPSNIGTGTFQLTSLGDYIGLYVEGTTTYNSSSGELVITEHNTSSKTIKGTFHFEAEDLLNGTATVSITAGSFTVTYQ